MYLTMAQIPTYINKYICVTKSSEGDLFSVYSGEEK